MLFFKMLPPQTQNCAAMFLTLFCGFCYGFVLISSASAGAGGLTEKQFFELRKAWNYEYSTRILLNEKGADSKDVGFSIESDVLVESVWSSEYIRLLRFTLKLPKLLIRSTKSHDTNGFTPHTSNLDSTRNHPFYVLWNMGKIEKVLLPKEEPPSLANIKKGIASLFQFQLLDQETSENDSSGQCVVSYISTTPTKFDKIKKSCLNSDLPNITNPDLLLGTMVTSNRKSSYELDPDFHYVLNVETEEIHQIYMSAKEEIGNKIEAYQTLKFQKLQTCSTIEAEDFDSVFQRIIDDEGLFTEETLFTEKEHVKNDELKTFSSIINDYRDSLKSKSLGSLASAKSIIPLIRAARKSRKDDINKALHSKKNQKILHQLVDILGYVQTMDSYSAVMNKIHFDDKKHEELSERYLWACSLASQPSQEIISKLLNKYKKLVSMPDKVKQTLLLSIASMANRLSKLPSRPGSNKVINAVKETIVNGLEVAKESQRLVYLRALRNLKVKSILPSLIQIIKTGDSKEGVLAWKAIRAMDPSSWNSEVLVVARNTFYQLDKQHDSSSRTLAVDIILASNPSDEALKELVCYLLSKDKAYEVKQYVLQQVKMMAEDDVEFNKKITNIIKNDPIINNYNILGQKGLSIALRRKFLDNPSSNGSLLTVQEMFGGIVKRGVVNVMMDKNGVSQEIFSLGVFSSGLGGFLSSDSDAATDEVATAGMELSVLGTQIRPFTFFEGQGELMGHVWSGTASDRTTAYQALAILQDHKEYLRLSPGFLAEIDLKGATSFDLAGRIEFSLWNRNAESLVEKSAGMVFIGLIKVENTFVNSQVEFMVSIEPKLNLQTNIDFYSNVNLCMRLTQPDSLFRHNVYKIERIPGSKHRLRKVMYRKYTVPGKTYALNKKNTEMCNLIFK